MNYSTSNFTLGILGGGQLGKMLLQVTSRLSIKTNILDPNEDSPCKNLCSKFTKGDLMDFDSVYNFGKTCDLVTYEIEHINVEALEKLEKEGIKVFIGHTKKNINNATIIVKSSAIKDNNIENHLFLASFHL